VRAAGYYGHQCVARESILAKQLSLTKVWNIWVESWFF
jgi:hypothetical protein